MFVLLGAVLEKARGGDLFMNLAAGLMGKQPGGPGKAAVLASGLFGSISGAAVANVYATGTFTIPLMIKTGFQRRFAAAVEAVASASGQLVPPIMGSAAFLIADFTRTPYIEVAKAAALPALKISNLDPSVKVKVSAVALDKPSASLARLKLDEIVVPPSVTSDKETAKEDCSITAFVSVLPVGLSNSTPTLWLPENVAVTASATEATPIVPTRAEAINSSFFIFTPFELMNIH